MLRNANTDEGSAGRNDIGDGFSSREQEGQGARPESVDEELGLRSGDGYLLQLGEFGDVDDEGIPVGALLGFEDLLDGFGRKRIRAKTVDGLSGEGDEAIRAQEFGGKSDIIG